MFGWFDIAFYQPLLNLLVYIYNIIPGHDIGVAIIIITLLIKLVLYPLTAHSLKSQRMMQDLQPKIDALKIKYKDQKELMAQELMKLYKEEKINPLSSCFPLLVQIPFFIAIYQVFAAGLSSKTALVLYPFVANPGTLNHIAFGFLNLGTPNWFLAVLAGAAQFWQAKMMPMQKPAIGGDGSKDENMAVMVNKQMTYFMPIMTLFIGLSLPGGLMLYWCVNSLFAVAQQKIAFRKRKELTVQVIDKK